MFRFKWRTRKETRRLTLGLWGSGVNAMLVLTPQPLVDIRVFVRRLTKCLQVAEICLLNIWYNTIYIVAHRGFRIFSNAKTLLWKNHYDSVELAES